MLLKNNARAGSPLRYIGGGALAALQTQNRSAPWLLPLRLAFGANSSYPNGYALHNAIVGPVTAGGNLAARMFAAGGTATGAVLGRGMLAGTGLGSVLATGDGAGIAPVAGIATGAASATWTSHAWPARLAGTIQIGAPTPEGIANEVLDGQLVGGGLSVRQALAAMAERLLADVPAGPVAVIPAPSEASQTVAWTYCYDESGQLQADVTIQIKLVGAEGRSGVAYDGDVIELTSDETGLAAGEIPRGAGLRFAVRQGSGSWVTVRGVNADTLALPPLIGK